jgi:hypothetical protein
MNVRRRDPDPDPGRMSLVRVVPVRWLTGE